MPGTNVPGFGLGFGFPELLLIFIFAVYIYGILMTIDAIRRPAAQYNIGNKQIWIIVLIISNPLICKFFGELIWSIGVFIFIIASISYHLLIRRHKDLTNKLPVDNDSGRIYDKEF